jgi:hypothetical protein
MKDEKNTGIYKKKINSLKLKDALAVKDFLERADQTNSKKYEHIVARIKSLQV